MRAAATKKRQRLAMYSVISKPKRKSMKAGVDQIMLYLQKLNKGRWAVTLA